MVYDRTRIFTLPIDPIETINYTFNNVVTDSSDRGERRIARRANFRASFSFDDITFKETEAEAFANFYEGSRANIDSFRFRSFIDNVASTSPTIFGSSLSENSESFIIQANGTTTAFTPAMPTFAFTAGLGFRESNFTDTWQLYKLYAITNDSTGANSIARSYKRIIEPDLTTLEVFVDGVQTTSFTFEPFSGTLNIPGTNENSVVTWTGGYFWVVRFDTANLSLDRISPNFFTLSGLQLIETVFNIPSATVGTPNGQTLEGLTIYNGTDFVEQVPALFRPNVEPQTRRVIKLPSLNAILDSGRESRIANFGAAFRDEVFESTQLREDEAFFISTFFNAVKGRLIGFQYEQDEGQRLVRFDQDSLGITRSSFRDEFNANCTVYSNTESNLVAYNLAPPPGGLPEPPIDLTNPFPDPTYFRFSLNYHPTSRLSVDTPGNVAFAEVVAQVQEIADIFTRIQALSPNLFIDGAIDANFPATTSSFFLEESVRNAFFSNSFLQNNLGAPLADNALILDIQTWDTRDLPPSGTFSYSNFGFNARDLGSEPNVNFNNENGTSFLPLNSDTRVYAVERRSSSELTDIANGAIASSHQEIFSDVFSNSVPYVGNNFAPFASQFEFDLVNNEDNSNPYLAWVRDRVLEKFGVDILLF